MISYAPSPFEQPQAAGHDAAPRDPSLTKIGPNSVIQTLRSLDTLEGPDTKAAVMTDAGLDDVSLEGMIPEAWFVRLVSAVRAALPPARSELVLARAGTLTAAYVRHHRIPELARRILGRLPPRIALPTLLLAIRRHAWTFAGGGRFSVEGGYPGVLILEDNPCCRADPADGGSPRGFPSGSYYAAAFEGLLQVAAPRVVVEEVACVAQGNPHCRFTVQVGGSQPSVRS